MSGKTLVLASGNAKKAAELAALMGPLGLSLRLQSDFGVSEADEPHPTFVENALAKARHASAATGLAAIADDSGLCVAALDGAPGVVSARFAGEPRSDARNNVLLLARLEGVEDRRAHFVCTLVLVRAATDPEPLIAEGRWHGQILTAPRGAAGFGYDPLFFVPALGCTAAEMSAADKNRHSHRALAMQRMLALLGEAGL